MAQQASRRGMGRSFEHTVHADTHVNVQDLMYAIAIRTKTPKNNKVVVACIMCDVREK